ncbi:Outer membrane protein TolC [Geoalkalibacter ferrihydriticus]|nr:TolC family protein [Geoalkalibacter ferrihydriticus]SDM42304.1 Outer membrane protein TolC [Geoalkalibacter ferrihydriticus]
MKTFIRRFRPWIRAGFYLWLAVSLIPAGAGAETLTLERALALARADNPALAEAGARIAQARAVRDESRAAFWPQLDVGLEYVRGDAPSAYLFKTIDARQLPEDVDFNNPGRFDNLETFLEARLNLFSGGRDKLRYEQAGVRLEQARSVHASVENDLSAAVIDTFLALLSARDRVAIARQSTAVLEREVELAEVRYAGGSLLRSDLLSLAVRLAEARSAQVRARGVEQRLQAALAVLLGRGAEAAFEPVGAAWDFSIPAAYSEALERALRQRPELAAAAQEREVTRLEEAVVRAEFLPRLDLQARLYHDDPDFAYDDDQINWTLGAQLRWNVFSGFATRARAARVSGQAQESRSAQRRLRQQVELEVRQAWLTLDEARANQTLAETAAAHAEQAFDQVRTQFSGGAVAVTRYLDAELTLQRSRVNVAAANRDRQRALAELARALGELGPSQGAQGAQSSSTERTSDGQNP